MNIGIISDTHDDLSNLKNEVRTFNERKVSYVIHAGDYVFPGVVKEFKNFNGKLVGVLGNNDGEKFGDRKSTRLNSIHRTISYAVFCLKKKKKFTILRHASRYLVLNRDVVPVSQNLTNTSHTLRSPSLRIVTLFVQPTRRQCCLPFLSK